MDEDNDDTVAFPAPKQPQRGAKADDPRYVPGVSQIDDDMRDEEWEWSYGSPEQT